MTNIYTPIQLYAELLTLQGWNVFNTCPTGDGYVTFSAEYTKDDGKFDKTSSYDIDCYIGARGNHVIMIYQR